MKQENVCPESLRNWESSLHNLYEYVNDALAFLS